MPPLIPDTLEPLVVPGRFRSILDRLQHVAAALPDAVALADDDRSLTFRELLVEIDRVAARIARSLPSGDEPVGVLLPHEAAAVVTLFAVVRLDRLFVFLDPAAPAARLADIVQTSGIRACVTTPALAALLDGTDPAVERIVDDGAAVDLEVPVATRGDDDAAFIVFTSGSTGRPKGVIQTHVQMLNNAYLLGEPIGVGPEDRMSLLFPMAFLGGPVSVFTSLLNGAGLAVFDARSSTPRGILDFVERARITVLGFAPHLLRASAEALRPGEVLDSVRVLSTGGEGIMGRDVEAFRAHLRPGASYLNGMGSSEASNLASWFVPGGVELAPGTVPAGRPTPNTEVWILREDGSRADVGETGQMMAVSRYLSGGYWRNESANAEKFGELPDGRRTFLLGDLGRFDEHGILTLVGRADTAVKVRGYLVDLSEVEDALRANDTIADAIVIPDTEPGGTTRLIAYIAQRATMIPDSVADIRRGLRETLPAYMVPGTIVVLAALPRNERGKVDRARLPKPVEVEVDDTGYTQHQLVVEGVWANVLGLEKVALDGDFLALGGDSLSVEEMLADIEVRYGIELASTDLMSAPTLREFAAFVEAGSAGQRAHPDLVQLRVGPADRRVFCFAGAGALALQFLPVARHLEGWAVHGVQAHGLEHRGMPDRNLQAQARRAVRDLREVQPTGPYFLVGHSYGGILALEVARRLRGLGGQVDLLTAIDTFLPASEGMEAAYLQVGGIRRDRIPQRSLSAKQRLEQRLAGARARHTTVPMWLGRVIRSGIAGVVRFRGQAHFDAFQRRAVRIAKRYRPQPYSGRTLVISARQESPLPADWSDLLTGEVLVASVVAEHSAVLREPHATDVARILLTELGRARTSAPSATAPRAAAMTDHG